MSERPYDEDAALRASAADAIDRAAPIINMARQLETFVRLTDALTKRNQALRNELEQGAARELALREYIQHPPTYAAPVEPAVTGGEDVPV